MAAFTAMQGALSGAIVGGAAGLAYSYWKRDSGEDATPGSLIATLRGANMHIDAEDAVQELIPTCKSLVDMKSLIKSLGALHNLAESDPPPGDSVLAKLRHSTEAQRYARHARDAITRLEIAHHRPEEQGVFGPHIDAIEQAIKDDLYNVNMATNAAMGD